jgi:hypothetical protein
MLLAPAYTVEDAIRSVYGFAVADPDLLQDYFGNLPARLQSDAIQWFREQSVTITQAYDRSEHTLPVISIQAKYEQTIDNYVGDELGFESLDDAMHSEGQFGGRHQAGVEICTYAAGRDQTEFMKLFTLGALYQCKRVFDTLGLDSMLINVSDITPDEQSTTTPAFKYTVNVRFDFFQTVTMRPNPSVSSINSIDIMPISS